jgi:hypothetical protein
MRTTPIHSRHLLVRLQHDWDHIKRSHRTVLQARGWCLIPDAPQALESLDDVLAWAGYGSGDRRGDHDDRILGQLVRLAATDQLAARVVLQRLLPGISALARRRATSERPRHEVLDEAVASAWTVIRTYPVDRKHRYVAVGLLREIEYQSFTRARRRLTTFLPRPLETFDGHAAPTPSQSPADELRELLDLADRAGMSDGDLDLARRLARGESTGDIARSSNVTDRTVRNRREAVTYRLRALALAGG